MICKIVNTTRKDHICYRCRSIIPKGSKVKTNTDFTGKTNYYHYLDSDCDFTEHRKRMRKINETTRKAQINEIEIENKD